MGFNNILTKLFGNKSQRDLKEINPFVEAIKAAYPAVEALSNDQLRALSSEIRNNIQASVSAERAEIERLKEEIETLELEEREKPYEQIDKIEKDITDKLEKALNDALPQVFSIVKDTARRFKENEKSWSPPTISTATWLPLTTLCISKVIKPSTKTTG